MEREDGKEPNVFVFGSACEDLLARQRGPVVDVLVRAHSDETFSRDPNVAHVIFTD
jgi:hypothetical protein